MLHAKGARKRPFFQKRSLGYGAVGANVGLVASAFFCFILFSFEPTLPLYLIAIISCACMCVGAKIGIDLRKIMKETPLQDPVDPYFDFRRSHVYLISARKKRNLPRKYSTDSDDSKNVPCGTAEAPGAAFRP